MQRAILRYALRFANQTRNRAQLQYRHLHQDLSNSPHNKDAKPSNIRAYGQSAPINIDHFRALIQPPTAAARKRYRLRWDWHLRNFLMALLPPAALLIFVKFIEWQLGGDMDKYEHLFPGDRRLTGASKGETAGNTSTSRDEYSNEVGIQRDLKTVLNSKLMERLERLEREVDHLRSQRPAVENQSRSQKETVDCTDQGALANARKLSRTIVRRGHEPD